MIDQIDPKKLSTAAFVELLTDASKAAEDGTLGLREFDPQDFARLISRASKEQTAAVMGSSPLRGQILDEVFRRMQTHFRTERAGSTKAVVHFELTGGPAADDTYQIVIVDGGCTIGSELDREPRAAITVPAPEFLKLASGNASAPVLFMTGKLKVKGDLGFAAGIMSLFDIPKA